MANAELFSPIAYPMLIEPNDWDQNDKAVTCSMRSCEVMTWFGVVSCIQGETPYQFLNKIQKVGYRLNSFIYHVAKDIDGHEDMQLESLSLS